MASSRGSSPASRRSGSATPTATRTSTHNPFDGLSASSSEDDEILRPRGKIASRMRVRGNPMQESESEEEHDVNSPRKSPPRNGHDLPSVDNRKDDNDNDEDEEVVTARPRKLMPRNRRSSTPETQPREAPSSPDLFVSPEKNTPQSPGLFVSPSKPQFPSEEDAQTSPAALTRNPRFLALVAKKRQERLAREAEEARKNAERQKAACHRGDGLNISDEDDDDITDDEGGRKLTQEVGATRPARKASKRALEEMNRETQRLTRSLQLAHEAKVKKKITKATLFERFNFKPEGSAAPADKPAPTSSSRPPTPGSAHHSDAGMKEAETPPSSPPLFGKDVESTAVAPHAPISTTLEEDEDDFPTLEEAFRSAVSRKKLDKGKGKATAADLEEPKPKEQLPRVKRNLRVKLPPVQANTATLSLSLDDDDEDLQIQPTRRSKLDAIFERVPIKQAQEPRPLQALRKLAQLDDPEKKATAPSSKQKKQHQERVMTVGELQANLLQRARAQAKLERDRHLEMLRAKGIHVQTAEEREKEMQQVEDIVERARKEAEEIMRKEREDAKKDRKARKEAGEEADPLAWDDDSDDEEYLGGDQEEAADIELSGSEEEDEGEVEGEEGEEGEADAAGVMIDDAAESANESQTEDTEEQAGEQESDEDEIIASKQARRIVRKQAIILSDDEEDEVGPLVKATPQPKGNHPKSPSVRNPESPSVPTSILRSATKTFIPGLPVAGPAGLGLTQIFAGTMDDSQMGTAPADSPLHPRPTFDVNSFPDSNFSQTAQEAAEDMILDSQPSAARETQEPETQGVQLRFSQSQMHGFDTFLEEKQNATQTSELIEPTQDPGFQNFSPLRQRFVEAPVSTVATVPVAQTQADADQTESPLLRRTGKLKRKADLVPASPSHRVAPGYEDDDMEDLETDEFGFGTVTSNAFAAMREAALKEKKQNKAFDKKKSKAREMIEEQAEESEDEYAGLGGADGEDSSDDDDHSIKEIIDDETRNNEVDERKLAAFYADRERAADEKQVEKLFHDITTGMLRRKRAGNWDDLSDSDDGGEARRRMKRRQFAKMQRALLADERISKVAENPRNQAFLRTIEDHGSDDDMDFILAPPAPVPASAESQNTQPPPAAATGKDSIVPASQPASNPRRTAAKEGKKKPSNLSEIRESLSNLLDEPLNSSSIIPATDLATSSEDEDEDEGHNIISSNKENHNPSFQHAHGARRRPTGPIVDRITLKRNSSSSSTSSSTKLAFATTSTTSTTTSTGSNSGFKVPALLRRATTNSLLSTSSTSSTSTGNTNSVSVVKKPAGKRSGISYLARESERRAAVAEKERRREERKFKGAEGRVRAVGGLFGAGRFE